MGGLTGPPLAPQKEESNRLPIVIGIAAVVIVVGIVALLTRRSPISSNQPHPYAANLKLSNLKMSAAENFVGASVTYLDGMITNSGDKTVNRANAHITFKDAMGQVTQTEDVPVHILQASGPYPDVVDLSAAPLAPGQTKPFRLTLEHVSNAWNREYPDLQITDVSVK
ncbi:MAG TPA: hypothetical protein VFA68_00225 [Terriglobales bacterium]|nr:hypothetical protein [Terriglobales bacterium]